MPNMLFSDLTMGDMNEYGGISEQEPSAMKMPGDIESKYTKRIQINEAINTHKPLSEINKRNILQMKF